MSDAASRFRFLRLKMFDRTTLRNFLAPRRQERKEKIFFCSSELGVLCVFARVISSRFYQEFQMRLARGSSVRVLGRKGVNAAMTNFRRTAFSLLVLLTFIAITKDFTWSAEKSVKLATVRIGYVSRSILDMPYIIARDRGLFREEGLEPELIFIKAAQTIPAMLAGGIDFGTATGTAVAAAVSGVDVRVVFALTDKPSFDLIAIPSITSVQQLRGKKLGVTAYGALAEYPRAADLDR